MTTTPLLTPRQNLYRSILLSAKVRGVTDEGIADCVLALDQNPSADELRSKLREYLPAPSERAEPS